MTDVLVKDKTTGYHIAVPVEFYETHKDDVELLKSPANDVDGHRLPVDYMNADEDTSASSKSGQPAAATKEK